MIIGHRIEPITVSINPSWC